MTRPHCRGSTLSIILVKSLNRLGSRSSGVNKQDDQRPGYKDRSTVDQLKCDWNVPDKYGLRTANGYDGGFSGEYVMASLPVAQHEATRAMVFQARDHIMMQTVESQISGRCQLGPGMQIRGVTAGGKPHDSNQGIPGPIYMKELSYAGPSKQECYPRKRGMENTDCFKYFFLSFNIPTRRMRCECILHGCRARKSSSFRSQHGWCLLRETGPLHITYVR